MFGRFMGRKLMARRFSLLAVLTLGLFAFTVSVAGATLKSVGPVNPSTGYPTTFTDHNNVTLEHCLDNSGNCLAVPPDPAAPPSVPGNFPDESFWWTTEADLGLPSGGTALLVLALEGAFANEEVVDGDQVVFGRVRLRGDRLTPGRSYVFTHPYGSRTLTADSRGEIRFTDDIGCFDTPCAPAPPAPGNFARALNSNVGPFLRWDPAVNPQAPAGYLGNPNVAHRIMGSPTGNNLFSVARTGTTADTATTNLFAVSGKIATQQPPPPAPAAASVTPASLAFGNQAINTVSGPQPATVRNTGGSNLVITTVAAGSANANQYQVPAAQNTCNGTTLAPNATCTVQVRFAPTSTGSKPATLVVTSNAPTASIPLSGTGVTAPGAPGITVNPPSIAFGNASILLGSSPPRTVTVISNGTAPLVVGAVTVTGANAGDFSITANSCSNTTRAPGATCSISVGFRPRALGARSASLNIASNASGSPKVVPMSGNGTLLGPI